MTGLMSGLFQLVFALLALFGFSVGLIWVSSYLFDFPDLGGYGPNQDYYTVETTHTAPVSADMPEITVETNEGKTFRLHTDDQGGIVLRAQDDDKSFEMKRNAEGDIQPDDVQQLHIENAATGKALNIQRIKASAID